MGLCLRIFRFFCDLPMTFEDAREPIYFGEARDARRQIRLWEERLVNPFTDALLRYAARTPLIRPSVEEKGGGEREDESKSRVRA